MEFRTAPVHKANAAYNISLHIMIYYGHVAYNNQ